MTLFERIEHAYMNALRSGNVPTRVHLTEDGLEQLIHDRTLGASWSASIESFWDQRVLGMPIVQSTASNALEVNNELRAL